MAGEESVSLRLIMTSEGIEVVDEAGKKISTLKRNAEDLGKAGASGFSSFQAAIVTVNQGLELAARIGRTVIAVYDDLTHAAIEQQNANAALAQTLRSTGQFSNAYVKELEGIAGAYQRSTRYGDEVVLNVERQLVAFGASRGKVKELTGAVLDLSEGMGKDLGGATLLMGKALAGEFGSLSRYGIIVNDSATRTQKLAQAIDQINERFGGQAASAAQTYGGRLDQLGNALGEIKEELGFVVVGSDSASAGLGRTTDRVFKMAAAIGEWRQENQELIDQGIDAFFDTVGTAARATGDGLLWIVDHAEGAKTALKTVVDGISATFPTLNAAIVAWNALHTASQASGIVDPSLAGDNWTAGVGVPFTSSTGLPPPPTPDRPDRPSRLSSDEIKAGQKAADEAAKGLVQQRKEEFELAKATGATLLELQQKLSLEQQAELATAKSAQEQESIRVKYRHELLDLTYEFAQVELQNQETYGDAQLVRDQTGLALAQDRLSVAQAQGEPTRELLALGAEVEAQERRIVDDQIAGLEIKRQGIEAALEAKKITDETAASQNALVDAQEAQLRALGETRHTVDDIKRGSQIDLGGSIQDVIKGTALGTGNIGDSLKRLGQTVGSELFSGMLEEKAGFDLKVSKNFLQDIPGWFETGTSAISDTWSSVMDSLGIATDRSTSNIAGSFESAFKDIGSQATSTAQQVGGTLRNIPGVGNLSALSSNFSNVDIGGAQVGLQRTASGGVRAVNEFDQQFTGPAGSEAQVADVAAGGTDGGASGAGSAIAAGAASFGIGLGIQMFFAGLQEKKRIGGLAFPTAFELYQASNPDPIQVGLANLFGSHNEGISRVTTGLSTLGFSQLFPTHLPTGEGLIGKALGEVLTKQGTPIPIAAGGRNFGSSHVYGGSPGGPLDPRDPYYPQVPLPDSYANIDRGPAGTLLASYVSDVAHLVPSRTDDYATKAGPVQQILNIAAALGLNEEGARGLVKQTTAGVAGNFDSGVLALRKFQQDTAQFHGSHGTTFGADDPKGVAFFTEGVKGLIEAFGDLPPAVDAGRLAVLALGEDGSLQLEALNRQIATAKKLAESLDLGGTFRAGAAAGFYGGGNTFQRTLNQNARKGLADNVFDAIGASVGAGNPFQKATDLGAQATEAFRAGNLEQANQLLAEARTEFEHATDAAGEYFQTIQQEAPEAAALLRDIRVADLTDQFKGQFGSTLAGAVTGGLSSKDFKTKVVFSLQQNVTEALDTAFVGQFGGFDSLSKNLASAVASIEQGDTAGAHTIFSQISHDLELATDAAGDFFDNMKAQFPELAALIDGLQLQSLAPDLEAGAKGLRQEADQLYLRGLKPRAREAEIRSRLDKNQQELDALRASPGGIDTADEVRRANELATERKGFYEDLLNIADERFADGSRQERAAFAEVQAGLTSVADLLDGLAGYAGITSPADALEKLGTGELRGTEYTRYLNNHANDPLPTNTAATDTNSVAVKDNTTAVVENTDALTKLAEAMAGVAASAADADPASVATALTPIISLIFGDERVRAAIKKIATQG